MNVKNEKLIRSSAHLNWVRSFYCVLSGNGRCNGHISAAYVHEGTDDSIGNMPSDVWVFPACMTHHSEQHAFGEKRFEEKYGLNLKVIARVLALMSPHRDEWADHA